MDSLNYTMKNPTQNGHLGHVMAQNDGHGLWAGSTICEALGYLGSEAPSPAAKPPPLLEHVHY